MIKSIDTLINAIEHEMSNQVSDTARQVYEQILNWIDWKRNIVEYNKYYADSDIVKLLRDIIRIHFPQHIERQIACLCTNVDILDKIAKTECQRFNYGLDNKLFITYMANLSSNLKPINLKHVVEVEVS